MNLNTAKRVEDLNRFLRGNKVVNVEKQLVTLNESAFWTFCIHYIGVENKSEIAKLPDITEKTMRSVQGIGDRKAEKYGKLLCNMLAEEALPTPPVGQPSDTLF